MGAGATAGEGEAVGSVGGIGKEGASTTAAATITKIQLYQNLNQRRRKNYINNKQEEQQQLQKQKIKQQQEVEEV